MSSNVVFYVILAVVLAMMARRFIRGRGFRGMLFGAPIKETIAEIDLGRRSMMSTTMRIYKLDLDAGSDVPDLALEIDTRTVGGFGIRCLTLTRSQAAAVANALYEGAGRPAPDAPRAS